MAKWRDRFNLDQLPLGEALASERTALAAERTLLAYLRTSLGAFAAGVAATTAVETVWIRVIGVLVIIASLFALFGGIWRYRRSRQRTMRYVTRRLSDE